MHSCTKQCNYSLPAAQKSQEACTYTHAVHIIIKPIRPLLQIVYSAAIIQCFLWFCSSELYSGQCLQVGIMCESMALCWFIGLVWLDSELVSSTPPFKCKIKRENTSTKCRFIEWILWFVAIDFPLRLSEWTSGGAMGVFLCCLYLTCLTEDCAELLSAILSLLLNLFCAVNHSSYHQDWLNLKFICKAIL